MKNVAYEIQKAMWRILNPTAEPFEFLFGNWSERHDDALKYSMRFATIATALMVAVFFAVTPIDEAEAAPLSAAEMSTAAPECSLPYVDDVQQVNGGYEALVTCAGSANAKLTVTDMKTKKTVKVTKLDARMWSVKLKKGRTYKLTVKLGKDAKSIKYGVC